MSDPTREEQRSRALALLAKSLKGKRVPSEAERAREERDFLKSALALSAEPELRAALADRLGVLRAQARAHAGLDGGGGSAGAAAATPTALDDDDAASDGEADASDASGQRAMRALLERWRDGDFAGAPPHLLDLGYWRQLAGMSEAMGVPAHGASTTPRASAAEGEHLRAALARDGYHVSVPSAGSTADGGGGAAGWAWTEPAASALASASLARAAQQLQACGWPPVFIFMLDEAWAVAASAAAVLAPALHDGPADDAAAAETVGLDTSVFCWIGARPPQSDSAAPARAPAGANFGTPHRDFTCLESTRESDGAPALLSAWVALTHVSAANGAMHVLPREFDPDFAKRWAYAHMRPALHESGCVEVRFDLAAARQLAPLPAGAVVSWCGNTVHWGGKCSAREPQPRVALGFNLLRAGVRLQRARPPLTRAQLAAGLSARERLAIVAGSLLLYAPWYDLDASTLPLALGPAPGPVATQAAAAARPPAAPAAAAAARPPAAPAAAAAARPPAAAAAMAASGSVPVVGTSSGGQPKYLPDSVRAALFAKYGDLSQVSGDPKDVEGCAQQ